MTRPHLSPRRRSLQRRGYAAALGALLTLSACSQSAVEGQKDLNAKELSEKTELQSSLSRLNFQAVNNLSDLTWTSVTNGWGPVEKDLSNGEKATGDGKPLTINGVSYLRGLGVHADSSVVYNLDKACTRLTARVGVDDEVGSRGSVSFQAYADGQKLYDSGTLTGRNSSRKLDINLTGKQRLELVVTDAGDSRSHDHADWVEPRLECQPQTNSPGAQQTVALKVPPASRSAPFDKPRSLKVPAGFSVSVYARITKARFMQPLPGGDLLVSQPSTGKVLRVQPGIDGAGVVNTFASGLKNPHDVVLHTVDGVSYLYLAESNRVTRSVYGGGDTTRRAAQTVVANLPDSSTPELKGAYSHALKNIALGLDHKLYVSVASATNQSPSDVTATFKRATIYQYNANGSGRKLFAEGIRNAEGLAFAPNSNDLWIVVNNRDNLAYPFHNDWQNDGTGDDYGKVIQSYVDNHPPEEFIKVRQGGNYGWPYCNPNPDSGLTNMPFDRDVQNNADGSKLNCAKADRITQGIQAHSAPLGLSFWQDGAAVALHGCWNCSRFVGHKVIYFPWTAAGLPGKAQDLVSGWVTNAVKKERWGRPVDVVADTSGNLFVSDDYANAVYKLSPSR